MLLIDKVGTNAREKVHARATEKQNSVVYAQMHES